MRCVLLLLIVVAGMSTGWSKQAHAAKFSGIYLMQLCDKDKNGKEKLKGGHIACQAYISGVLDYHSMLQSFNLAPKTDICVPKNATLNDLQDIVLAYLQRNGQHDGFIAAPVVTMALFEVFPCK